MPQAGHRSGYGLRDSPLFRLEARKKLSKLLRVSPSTLNDLVTNPELYKRCWKHKKLKKGERGAWLNSPPSVEIADDYRPIDKPDPKLKKIQSRISGLLGRVTPPDFLFSPVKGRSYVDNAARHLGAKAFWMLDVADYFPSCTANNVAHFFHQDLECSPDVTAILVRLTTCNESLPQGSPCSPILAYFANNQMWHQINNLIEKSGCKFSLYADDITISGPLVRKELIWQIKKIIHKHGFQLKGSKEVSLIERPADITGVIVRDGRTVLPNRQRKKLVELKRQHRRTSNLNDCKKLESQIAGRLAQQRQVEDIDPMISSN